jgi:hypothetical protein
MNYRALFVAAALEAGTLVQRHFPEIPAIDFPKIAPYTCITDAECEAECESRGDTHCDDMFYKEEK